MEDSIKKIEMSEEAKEARRKAARAWRLKNKEKTKEYNRRYWEKRALQNKLSNY